MFKITVITLICAISMGRSLAEIKIIESTSNSLHWDLKDVLEAGKRYAFEVLLKVPTGDVLETDGRLRSDDTTYIAYSLKSNKQYQLYLYEIDDRGTRRVVASIISYTNLVCYSCNGAQSVEQCTTIRECPASHRECYAQVRYYNNNGRDRFFFFKGCQPPKKKCLLNEKRAKIIQYANSPTGDLTTEEILQVMPGLKFFDDIEGLLKKSSSIMKDAKNLHQRKKDNALENAIKEECARGKEDTTDFCRCCCSGERCNHAMLDCGTTAPPEIIKTEPLPPDIATPPPETTFPLLEPTEPPPACRDFNGGCDHICIAVNRTIAKCKCLTNYKLHQDGKACTTHLKHAIAEAGPDITVTLPVSSVIISAKNTRGAVKRYKWWNPIAVNVRGRLTISDPYQRDLTVTNLVAGEYRFVLMVTGQDGRRTSDTMTLTVLPNPRSVTVTTTLKPRRTRPRTRLLSFSRFSSSKLRREWQSSGNRYQDRTLQSTRAPETSKTTTPKLRFRVIPGVRETRTKPSTTTPTSTTRLITTPTITTTTVPKTRSTTTTPTTTSIATTTATPTTTTTTTTITTTTTTAATTTPAPVVCSGVDELEEREVTATCTNSNFKGSQCEFRCEGKRKLQGGANFATCQVVDGTGRWLSERKPLSLPCCQLPCPANAYGDIIFLIHSTTRNSRNNWLRLLRMANSALKELAIGRDDVCVGAVRYNGAIDVQNEIPLNCSRSKDEFESQLLRLPNAGSGTNTDAGLDHLRTNSFAKSANRKNAQDIAILIINSRSTGSVAAAATALKASGVKIIVIGVRTPASSPNRAEMRSIATSPKGAIYLPRVPGQIPSSVKNQIRSFICDRECKRFN